LSGGALSGIRTDKTHYPEALVVESERPERQNIQVSVFDVIFDYECILGAFDLFLLFGLSTYFESMSIYKKICNRRRSDLIVDT
jgi:hypothetical protein